MAGRFIVSIAIVSVASLSLALGFAGCGSESDPAASSENDAGGQLGQPGEGGAIACAPAGSKCAGDLDCCSAKCDTATKLCVVSSARCSPAGTACTTATECCSTACVGGACAEQCVADGADCTQNEECCGGACSNGKCTPLSTKCKSAGNPCADNAECCSHFCKDGICSAPSFCAQTGDTCASDAECCGGACNKAAGAALGLCAVAPATGAGNCKNAGEVCGGIYDGGPIPECGSECCSRSCRPFGPTGVFVCQPPSGCRPTGEICREDADCCGSATQPHGDRSKIVCSKPTGAAFGRCDNGNACTPAGGICRLQTRECRENPNCCSGQVIQHNTCKQDSLGIPRCLIAEIDCTGDPSSFNGKACASSADCCGLPCVPNPAGTPPLVCNAGAGGTSCIPAGGACTTTADCCAGLPCHVPPGALAGTCGGATGGGGGAPKCSEYGQQCSATQPCCNNVPCTNGYCYVNIDIK